MGAVRKAAGVATTVVAPEAKAAQSVAGSRAGADPRVTAPGSNAARQRQSIEDIKARRKPEPAAAATSSAPAAPAPSSSGPGLSMPAPVAAAAGTGGGFLLGLFGWALGLAYLRGGSDGVKQLMLAKFLNKTS